MLYSVDTKLQIHNDMLVKKQNCQTKTQIVKNRACHFEIAPAEWMFLSVISVCNTTNWRNQFCISRLLRSANNCAITGVAYHRFGRILTLGTQLMFLREKKFIPGEMIMNSYEAFKWIDLKTNLCSDLGSTGVRSTHCWILCQIFHSGAGSHPAIYK